MMIPPTHEQLQRAVDQTVHRIMQTHFIVRPVGVPCNDNDVERRA